MEDNKGIWLMKRTTLLFLTLAFPILLFADVPTPSVVSNFYDSMKRLSKVTSYREANEIATSMKKLTYTIHIKKEPSGDRIRNDFQFFKYDEQSPSHNDVPLNVNLYVNKLKQYMYEDRVMNVDSCNVLRSDYYGEAIDLKNGSIEIQKQYIITFIEKTYTINNQTTTFRDTLLTHIPTNTICKFCDIEIPNDKDIMDLKRQAARYYYQKQYTDAYRCFEEILAINANDGESLYRLGLMTYYGKGCSITSKKSRHRKGKEYMIRASQSDISYGFKDKAEIVLKNWKYGPGLM